MNILGFRKAKLLAILFVAMFFVSISMSEAPIARAETSYTPKVFVYSTIQKDIVDMDNIWMYKDSDGNNASLQYWEVDSTKNISFDILNVELEKQFENASVSGVTTFSTGVSGKIDLLRDSNGISYLLIKAYNTSSILASTWYTVSLEDSVDIAIDNNYYIILAGKISALQGTIANYNQKFMLKCVDTFGNAVNIRVLLNFNASETYWIDSSGVLNYMINASKYNVLQIKIQDIFDKLGVSYNVVKVKSVVYEVLFKTDITLSSYYEIAGMFYIARVVSQPFKINNVFLHKLSTVSIKGDKITSTLKIAKIADAKIPAVLDLQTYDPSLENDKEPFVDVTGDPNTGKIKFDYKFSLVDDPAIHFSNTYVNLTLPSFEGFDVKNITSLYVDTEDKLSLIENSKPGDTVTILSNPTVGNLHSIEITIKYDPEVYNIIMGEGIVFWYFITHPADMFYYVLGVIIAFLGGYFGFRKRGEETKAKGLPKTRKGLREL